MSDEPSEAAGDWLTEHRYRAVLQVLDGVPKAQVAREFGTSRQSVHSWVARYEAAGLAGRSRRPDTSPNELAPAVIATICELRRTYPRWGAQRIAHELMVRGTGAAPSRSSVYRVLVITVWWRPNSRTTNVSSGAGSAMPRCSCGNSTLWAGCSWLMAASASW